VRTHFAQQAKKWALEGLTAPEGCATVGVLAGSKQCFRYAQTAWHGLRPCTPTAGGGAAAAPGFAPRLEFFIVSIENPNTKKRPGGRPPLDADLLRDMTIGVRVSAEEYELLKAKALQLSIPPARLLRECALSRKLPSPPVPAINREMYAELARLSANINQLAHAANCSEFVQVDTDLLNKVGAEVAKLRLALLAAG